MDDFVYDPANWYWIVAGDESRVYSSARSRYVAPSDQTYYEWLAGGGQPTRIKSAGDLDQVLKAAGLPGTMPSPDWDWGMPFVQVLEA